MYTGSNKTALSSQQQIAEAFVSLLENRAYSSISVSEICKKAGVSRQTFYSLFSSRENIISYVLEKKHGYDPGKKCSRTAVSLAELSASYAVYITKKKHVLSLLVRNDIIYLMHESLYASFLSCSCFLPARSTSERTYCAEFFASGLSAIAKSYIQQGAEESAEELERIICRLFSGAFFKSAAQRSLT